MDKPGWLMYVLILVLIAMSAFFSSSETAYSSVNTMRLKSLAENGNQRAKTALKIAEQFDKTLSTILVGNNVVNISISSIGTVVATALVGASMGPLVSTVIITIVVLIFGEILPKSLAKENSEKVALGVAPVLGFLIWLLRPISAVFLRITQAASSRFKGSENQPSVTEDELKYIIETIEEEGILDEQESELVQSALEFDDLTVQQILTPRVDLVAVNVEDSLENITQIIVEGHCSRIPVYEKTIDNIIGILYTREFLESLAFGKTIEIRGILHNCPFVHKTMKISRLLNQLKKEKTHLAVVTDDYGGTMGIVTMEDILEELVGEIWDERDEVEQSFLQIDDTHFEVSGDLNVLDMFDLLDFPIKDFDSDYSSMGGWAMENFQHIPQVGESFSYQNLVITVKELEDQRILKLLVEKLPKADKEEDSDDYSKRT